MSSSFDINCTVEGAAPDNLTHECGVTKNLTWTGNGTHSGLSFNLIRSQLTDLSPKFGYIKAKASKIIKFAFTPINPNIGSSKVTVRVKYNIDGVLTIRETYDLGNISSTVYKFHELLVDLDVKNNAFLILDVITSDGTSGAISVTIDCAPAILSAEFCYGFTNTNQYCNLCPQTVTFYREKSPGTNTSGLINNNSTSFTDFTKGPWYVNKELTTEVSENIPYQFKNELGVSGTSVYTYSGGNFILESVCNGTTIGCSFIEFKSHFLNATPTDFKYQNPYMVGTPNIKLDGLRYSIKETTVELTSKHQLVEVKFYWTGGTANRVAYQVTDGNYENSVGKISTNTLETSALFYPADNETLFEVKDKGTTYTRFFITTTGKLKIRAIVGLKNGTISNYENTITRILVGGTNGVCGVPIYSYNMDVHPYSPYDSANSAKVKTTVYSLTPIEDWVNGTTKIYNDPLLSTLALPYYYYNSTTNKVYKIGSTELHREWGTKTRYKVSNSFLAGSKTSVETLGPKDWTIDFSGIKSVPACIEPVFPQVGVVFSATLKTNIPQPTYYSYLLGYNPSTKSQSNDNFFTTYDFQNESWSPITGYEHALGRMLRKYIMSTNDKTLNDQLESERWAGGGLLGRFMGVFTSGILLGSIGIAFGITTPIGIMLIVLLIITDIFTKGKVWDILRLTFGTFTKIYEENCKELKVRYGVTPYLSQDTSYLYKKENNTDLTETGYYCDGFYFYQLNGGQVISKELAYSTKSGIRKNSIPLVNTEKSEQNYITDFDTLLFLSYTAGRPTKYSVPTFSNAPLSFTTSNQSSTYLGELNNYLPVTYEIGEGRVIAFSQVDADNQAQLLLTHTTSTSDYLQSKEFKPGNEEIIGVFTHQIKDENTPNIITINYNNADELGITIGKKLYYDVDGYYSLLNGYYSVSPGSYKKVYKVVYGYVTDILIWENENDTTVTSVTTGTHSVVTTNKDYTSQWLVGSNVYQDVDFDFGNDLNGLEENWNTEEFYTGSTVFRAMVKGETVKDSILVFDDNDLTTTTYSEAEPKMYRQMYPFASEVETYYTPNTFTIKSEEICDLDADDTGVKFTVYDSDNRVTPSIVGVTFTANFYSGSSVLFATETVTIAPESTETLLQLNIPYSGHTVTSVDIVSYESPNPFNKVTFEQGTHTESDGVVPCDYYTGLTYQVISYGFVQYTDYIGEIIFTNQTEGVYTIDDTVEYGSVFGSLDEDYFPSANIRIIEHGGCITSPKPTDITIDNNSVDEGTPIGTEIATFSTVSATPEETYVYNLVSGAGSTDNASFGLTTGGTLTNLETINYDVKTSYSIRVRSGDSLGGFFVKSFTITVNDVNRAPYGLTLSNSYIMENESINTTIGEFTGLDYDENESFTYTLFDNQNYPDNSYFNINTTTDEFDVEHSYLRNSAVFNYETKTGYTINVKVTDSGNLSFESTFNISIGNVDEQPLGVYLSNTSVYENLPSGTTVGIITTYDEDVNDTYTYTFANALEVDDDNYLFYIDGDRLKTKHAFDYEDRTTYIVVIRATQDVQNGFTATQIFYIDILNVYVNLLASATSDFNGYNVKCGGESNGVITVSEVSGNGTVPYTYSKDGSSYQPSATFTGLTAGTYTIYAKESGGEVGSITGVTVTQPDELGFEVTNVTKPTCYNDNNGSFTLVGTGGVSPYTYSLDGTNYTSLGLFQNKSATSHNGYVKDKNDCIYGPAPISNLIVTQPNVDAFVENILCYGNSTGTILASNPRLGNGAPYMTRLLNSEGTVLSGYTTYTTGTSYTGLTAGDYYVEVKDVSGCTYSKSATVSQPQQVTVTFSNVTKPTCYSGNTGSFRVTASGGSGDLYSYRNGGSGNWTGFSGNYIDFTSKNSGTYSIQFKDRNDCVSTVGTVDLNVPAPDGTISITGATCYGGSDGMINVSALTGNTGPYSAKLEFGGVTIDTYRVITTNRTYTGLTQGTYLVYFKDGNGCEKSYGAIVTEPTQVTSTLSLTPPVCYNDSNGSITVSASGGTGPYTYSKDGTTFQSSSTFSNLPNGTYTITTKDSVGCTTTNTNALERTQISATITPTNVFCYNNTDGRINVSGVTGGQGTYSVKLNSNGTYESISSSKTYSGLSAGSYTVYIKDVVDCERTYSVTITQPTQLTISGVGTSPTCYDGSNGSITVTSNGGTGTKTYYISSNGVNYGSPTTGTTFSNLSVGTYSFLVVDANSCTAFSSDVTLSKLAPSATDTITHVTCNGGSNGKIVLTSFTNGVPPYAVSTNGGNVYGIVNTSFTYSGLTSGNYTLFIKDSNDCIKSYLYTITQPSALSCAASGVAPTCWNGSNGTVTASGSGGVSPYSYSINDGSTYQSSGTFTGLTNGSYVIKVKDANDCTANSSTVTLNRTSPDATFVIGNVTCNGGTNGSLTVSDPFGGSGSGYSVSIDNVTFHSLPKTFGSLTAGTYTTYLKDSSGCISSFSSTVSQPAVVSFTYTQSPPTCWNGSNGSVTFTPSGGNGSYQYSINNSTYVNTSTITGLTNGTYTLRVRDTNLCYSSTSDLTMATGTPNANLSSTDNNGYSVSCYGGSDGEILTSGPSTTSTFFRYNFGSSFSNTTGTKYNVGGSVGGLTSGNWAVRVYNAAETCYKDYTITLTQPTINTASLSVYQNPTWAGNVTDAVLTLNSSGGVWPKTYKLYADTTSPYTTCGGTLVGTWSNISEANKQFNVTGLTTQGYCLEVTDANGCVVNSGVTEIPAPPTDVTFTPSPCEVSVSSSSVTVDGVANQNITINVVGYVAETITLKSQVMTGSRGQASVSIVGVGSYSTTSGIGTNFFDFNLQPGSYTGVLTVTADSDGTLTVVKASLVTS